MCIYSVVYIYYHPGAAAKTALAALGESFGPVRNILLGLTRYIYTVDRRSFTCIYTV